MERRKGPRKGKGRAGRRSRPTSRRSSSTFKNPASRAFKAAEKLVKPEGIRVGVGAVILDQDGRVLMVKHHPSDTPRKYFWKGKWICPGGMLEFGEGLDEGARREVREETGLEIELIRVLEPAERTVPWKGKPYMQIIYIDFLARVKRGKLRPGDDVAICVWFTREELEMARLSGDIHEDAKQLLERAGIL